MRRTDYPLTYSEALRARPVGWSFTELGDKCM